MMSILFVLPIFS